MNGEHPWDSQTEQPTRWPDEQLEPIEQEPLLGAVDIVEAFTGLRHELKLQVRQGRELRDVVEQFLPRLEQLLASQLARVPANSDDGEARTMAEALSETEESLERVVTTLDDQATLSQEADEYLGHFDQQWQGGSWIARWLAGRFMPAAREQLVRCDERRRNAEVQLTATHAALKLLLARVHRLMQQCDLERVDVWHEPFDADMMHAVDVMEAPAVPSSHVAEQLRPAYLWRGKILRYADVRLAR